MKRFLLYYLKLALMITGIVLGIASVCLGWINFPTSPIAVVNSIFFIFAAVGSMKTIKDLLKGDE